VGRPTNLLSRYQPDIFPDTPSRHMGRTASGQWRGTPLEFSGHYFDLLDPLDWFMWIDWCSKWPEREFGQSWLVKQSCTVLQWFFSGVAFIVVAAYFGLWSRTILLALTTPMRGLLFLPALAYRLSLKASALTYAPLLFVVEGSVVPSDDPKHLFEEEQFAVFPCIRRWLAQIIGAILLLKFLLITVWTTGMAAYQQRLATYFPHQLNVKYIYPWEIAETVVVVVTFVLWIVTKNALWKLKNGQPVSLGTSSRLVVGGQRLRTVLSIYTIICAIFLWSSIGLFKFLQTIHWPPVRWLFFPLNGG
jgi:hypothetical protein